MAYQSQPAQMPEPQPEREDAAHDPRPESETPKKLPRFSITLVGGIPS